MRREEQKNSREKEPGQKLFVLLKRVNAENDDTRRKQSNPHDVKWNEYFPLKWANARGLELDGAEHPNDEKDSGESNQGVSQHLDFLACTSY
jgi:hypothetical protein